MNEDKTGTVVIEENEHEYKGIGKITHKFKGEISYQQIAMEIVKSEIDKKK